MLSLPARSEVREADRLIRGGGLIDCDRADFAGSRPGVDRPGERQKRQPDGADDRSSSHRSLVARRLHAQLEKLFPRQLRGFLEH